LGHRAIEINRTVTKSPDRTIFQVWLSASQGLRGSFLALSGAGKSDLPHWKPWRADGEKRDLASYVSFQERRSRLKILEK
jgi:hypothetical protein